MAVSNTPGCYEAFKEKKKKFPVQVHFNCCISWAVPRQCAHSAAPGYLLLSEVFLRTAPGLDSQTPSNSPNKQTKSQLRPGRAWARRRLRRPPGPRVTPAARGSLPCAPARAPEEAAVFLGPRRGWVGRRAAAAGTRRRSRSSSRGMLWESRAAPATLSSPLQTPPPPSSPQPPTPARPPGWPPEEGKAQSKPPTYHYFLRPFLRRVAGAGSREARPGRVRVSKGSARRLGPRRGALGRGSVNIHEAPPLLRGPPDPGARRPPLCPGLVRCAHAGAASAGPRLSPRR